MKTMAFFALLIVFLPSIASAQDRIEAPVWNIGDKWTFTGDGSVEVIKADQNGYILKFSDKTCSFETQGCKSIFSEKSTRNRINAMEGDKRKKYLMGLSKILNFPLSVGKQWKYSYSDTVQGWAGPVSADFYETYKVSGWEDTGTGAGKFKTLRLEYLRHFTTPMGVTSVEIKHVYWYSPDAKYFVKCEYDKDWLKGQKDIFNWELTNFQLKK